MDWAKIPKQTFLVEDGKIGDCWRCCVAAVLGLPAVDVPHFCLNEDGTHNHNDDADTQRWLNARGLQMVLVSGYGGREAVRYPCYHEDLPHFPPPLVISIGPTCRSKGRGRYHAVVTQGTELLYDPHPSEAGITAIVEQYLIFPIPGFRG
jgi:hypothetical protein